MLTAYFPSSATLVFLISRTDKYSILRPINRIFRKSSTRQCNNKIYKWSCQQSQLNMLKQIRKKKSKILWIDIPNQHTCVIQYPVVGLTEDNVDRRWQRKLTYIYCLQGKDNRRKRFLKSCSPILFIVVIILLRYAFSLTGVCSRTFIFR